jgi:hypothetical protein
MALGFNFRGARGVSGITQKTVVLNDFGLAERQRTNAKGRTSARWTVQIKADKLPLLFDAKKLGQGPAEAIVRVLQEKIRGIGETVTPATQFYRQRALQQFRAGVPWAKRRYGGLYIPPNASIIALPGATGKRSNRLPPMEPGATSPSFWRDSGRFIQGLVVRPTKNNEWVVNVPANRLDPVTFNGGRDKLLEQVARLQKLVPELGDAAALEQNLEVRQAIGDATDQMLFGLLGKTFLKQTQLRQQLRAGRLAAARATFGALGELGGLLAL